MTHNAQEETYSKTLFGFWIYILTDFVMFATLFATYIVLFSTGHDTSYNKGMFDMPFILFQTVLFLCSSFTVGLSTVSAHRKKRMQTLLWMGLTFILGVIFLDMEFDDLSRMLAQGYTWRTSGLLSGFFTLVGTHIVHVCLGLLWMIILAPPIIASGISPISLKRLMCLKLFWQFLNVIWVLIFAIVYLMGAP